MELMIIISLLFDIVRDRILIAVFPYGTCKIPVRPEFSSPKLFFYLGTPLEYFPCCNAFDCRYDPCHTIRWNRLYEEMHMVLIRAYLQKLQLVALLNFYAHVFHCFINAWVKYRTSVFGRKYQMVYEYRNIMTLVDIFAHIDILRRKRRGIQPDLIEAEDVHIHSGENRIDFPVTNYRFSRSDHCFAVEADIENTRRPIDLSKEFCARRTSNGWTMSDRGISPLYVEDLNMNPDPVTPGQEIRFKVRLRNDGRPIRGNMRIQDEDQVVVQVENVFIPRGYSDFQFPFTRYSFQRFDHCFKVLVDIERTPYPVDAAREFCAKPTGWTLRP